MEQSPQTISNSEPTIVTKGYSHSALFRFIIAFLLFFSGTVIGFIASTVTSQTNIPLATFSQAPVTTKQVSLPKDARLIQTCEDKKGMLYIDPKDIPKGPVYMKNKNQILGIEYMVDTLDSIQLSQEIQSPLDHIEIHFLPNGHEGYSPAHYMIDFYFIDKNLESLITCPPNSNQTMNMDQTQLASGSASPFPTTREKLK